MLDCFEHTDGCLLAITTDNASSNYLMTRELESTLEASGINTGGLWNRVACIEEPHTMHGACHTAAVGVFMSSLGVKGPTKSWEAREHD